MPFAARGNILSVSRRKAIKRLATALAIVVAAACTAVLGGLAPAPSRPAGGSSAADGELIAFFSNRDGNYEIYKTYVGPSVPPMPVNPVRLTKTPEDESNPDWSPVYGG